MRLLLIHGEDRYWAGAEKMLGYFLPGLAASEWEVCLAVSREGKVAELAPPGVQVLRMPSNTRFSPARLCREVKVLWDHRKAFHFDVVHGWGARDWELTALVGRLARRRAVGTLHDHPRAPFHSTGRRLLMRLSCFAGLGKVVCVSQAVQTACVGAGYDPRKLVTIQNGLPAILSAPQPRGSGPVRLGFLGVFSERKGLRGLFAIIAGLAERGDVARAWELWIAGEAQDAASQALVAELRRAHAGKPWWNHVHWAGWVSDPGRFLGGVDVLIFCSTEFDPFPTVLLEAGLAEVPVVAARVGGVPEIVEEGRNGWLFDPGRWDQAAECLALSINEPERIRLAGVRAAERVRREFTTEKMVADYLELYSSLARDG